MTKIHTLMLATAVVLSMCVASVASADTLILSDGTRVNGSIVSITDRMITFKDTAGVSHRYRADEVESIQFTSATWHRAAPDSGRLETLPSGTALDVRTTVDIDTATAALDQTFAAIVEHDIRGESNTVTVPAGSRAVLVVREVSSGGAAGSPDIVLDVQSLTVGGRRYLVSTSNLKEDSGTGIGKNKRTAETVGGGATIGTIIGAIAGGAKGAAIGVLVGAAGGAGVQMINKGKDLRVPAETLLTFRLDKPVSLRADQ